MWEKDETKKLLKSEKKELSHLWINTVSFLKKNLTLKQIVNMINIEARISGLNAAEW